MAGIREDIRQSALETIIQTRGAPRRTTGQQGIISFDKFLSSLEGKKKKGAIQYTLAGGTLSGRGEGFTGSFTSDDIRKFSDSQFKDLGKQLGYTETNVDDIRNRLFQEMN